MNRQAQKQLARIREAQELSARRGAIPDLFRAVSGAGAVRLWMEILSYLRRFRTLRILVQTVSWLVTLLQAGTLIVLTTAVFFVLLPLLGGLAVFAPLAALADRRRSEKRLSQSLADSHEAVFFFSPGRVAVQTARELAAGGRTVFFVSRHWLSGRAPDGQRGRYFVNLRQESDRVFLIRRYFFFRVRKLAKERKLSLAFFY